MINLNDLILIPSVGVDAFLGMLVLCKRHTNHSTQLFLLMIVLIICWTIANYSIDASHTSISALFWTRFLYASALAYIYVFFLFARSFSPLPSLRLGVLPEAVAILAFGAIFVTLDSGLVFGAAAMGPAGLLSLSFGPLYLAINLFALLIVALAITEFGYKARIAGRTILRDQMLLIIAGWVSFLGLVIIFAAILPYYIPSLVNGSKIAPLFSILMIGCTTYSIVRHRFLDITFIIRRGLVYSMLLGTILGFYVMALLILAYVIRVDSDAIEFVISAATIIAGIFSAPYIESYFQRLTDRIFFKDTYVYSDVLEQLCEVLNTTVRIPQLIASSLYMLNRILKPKRIEFAYLKTKNRYDMSGDVALPFESLIPGDDGLVVPVHTQNRLIGEFLLWPKRSGDSYTNEDRSLLRTFANQATVAIEKAELYEELKQHSNQLEGKVIERTRHLEDLRTNQRQFMDDISHALQTPLTVLTSAMETVASEKLQNRSIQIATHSIEELSRLTSNLLALARVDGVPDESAEVRFSLSELLDRIIEYVEVLCSSQGILVTSDISAHVYINGNQNQIDEAITNILSNAVRYTSECPIRTICVRLMATDADAILSIEDSGTGISTELLPHIFERFYRAQTTQGSGIGLAITKRIIDRHNGSIQAESTVGTGTIMTVRLPRARE